MKRHQAGKSPIGRRLREARTARGLSQKQLGVNAGIDVFSASARINQYERDKHMPDFGTATRLAMVLGVPAPYLYADDDEVAEVLRLYSSVDKSQRRRVLQMLQKMAVG